MGPDKTALENVLLSFSEERYLIGCSKMLNRFLNFNLMQFCFLHVFTLPDQG